MDEQVECFDCCWSGTREETYYSGLPGKRDLEAIHTVIKSNSVGINTLLLLQFFVFCLWLGMSLVPGFALYVIDPSIVTPSGWAHSVSHLGWWIIIEAVVVYVGQRTTGFSLSYVPVRDKLQYSLISSHRWIIFHIIVLALAMVSDVTHIVLTGLEIRDAESTFYVQEYGFLIAFFSVLIAQLVLIKSMIMWRISVYYRNLTNAAQANLSVFDATSGNKKN